MPPPAAASRNGYWASPSTAASTSWAQAGGNGHRFFRENTHKQPCPSSWRGNGCSFARHPRAEHRIRNRTGRTALRPQPAGTNPDKDLIRRGDWIVAGALPPPVHRIDARLRVLGSEVGVLAHWTPVHIHLGAAETTGRVAVLGDKGIPRRRSGTAGPGSGDRRSPRRRANHSRPVGATDRRRRPGDRRLFTDARPCETERIAFLRAMEEADDGTALSALLENSPDGLFLDQFAGARNGVRRHGSAG